ncbi:armadillo-type protein [Entophlyctis helioformis]|nr:armadillo-type protein [Entophlyctis helioformis]
MASPAGAVSASVVAAAVAAAGGDLGRIFTDLRTSRTDEARARATADLRNHVAVTAREISGEAFAKFSSEVYKRIFELITSPDNNEKLGGVTAIDRLIDLESGEENTTKLTRFANYLRNVLPGPDPQITILTARALGRLANLVGALSSDFVESETKRSLEWLQGDRNEARRLAAVLVLKELISNAPTILYAFVAQIIDHIWSGLRDPKVTIREGAADALSECLGIVQLRDNSLRRQWYRKIYEEAQRGVKSSSLETVHGSLLALREILLRTSKFVDSARYAEICDIVMRFREHREGLVRRTVISIMPNLAQFDPNQFVVHHLASSMQYLLSQLKKEKERPVAFVAIGKISIAVSRNIASYLDLILASVKESLVIKGKGRIMADNSALQCIAMLAAAVGPALTKHMHELLDSMFAGSLTEALCQTLVDLSRFIPPLLPTIQERLMTALSVVLRSPVSQNASPTTKTSPTGGSLLMRDNQTLEIRDDETLILALKTLGTFDFRGLPLDDLVKICAEVYLEDENPHVRKTAAISCCMILLRSASCYKSSSIFVSSILERILSVGITDPEPSIRLVVLQSLNDSLDRHLAKSENAKMMLIALNDEVFQIREAAMAIVCPLRKLLIKLLTEIEYAGFSRQKEEGAQLLGQLVSSADGLVVPYVEPVLKVLLPKARDPSPGVASKVMAAIGLLAHIGCEGLIPYLDQLIAIILETLQDQSSPSKREAALRTLCLVASNTGWVVEPFLKHPNLLNLLIQVLKSEQAVSIRREAAKVLGALGALDPYRHKVASRSTVTTGDAGGSTMPLNISPSSDEYYYAVAIHAVLRILRDPSLSVHHMAVVTAIMYMFKTLGNKCAQFLPDIMPALLTVMRSCPSGSLEFYFQQLGALVSIVKLHLRNYVGDVMVIIQENWNTSSSIQNAALSLVELTAVLWRLLDTDATDKRQTSIRVLKVLAFLGSNLDEYLHLAVPAIVRVFERTDNPGPLRKQAVQLVSRLARKGALTDQASRLIHPLVRLLASPNPELSPAAMDALCFIARQIGDDYLVFIPMIAKTISRAHIQHNRYDTIVSRMLSNEPLPDLNAASDAESDGLGDHVAVEVAVEASAKKLMINQQQLRKAWEVSSRSTRDDWNEWIRRLGVEMLKESPSHALRACASLAGSYPALARELFNAGFVSCWGELYDQFQDELVRSLETALTSSNIPPEIIQTLLNLAEFMEHDDKALPIDIRTLGLYAAKCHAYAKALHYKELEFISEPLTNTIEALISINNQLQQPDSAIGILTYAQQNHAVELKESWYEKLQRWEDGLAAYERKQAEDPGSVEAMLGRMRCMHNLGEWEGLSDLAQERWAVAKDDVKKSIAPLGAGAAWGLGKWDAMEEYIGMMKKESGERAFFQAILAVHRNLFPQAFQFIQKTRDLLDTELTALMGESYNRAYNTVVRLQMLTELEEIIQYKQVYDQPEAQAFIRKKWMTRIKGCQRNVEVWQRILKVRALVVSPKEDADSWIKFSNLCRKSGRLTLSQKTLSSLLTEQNKDFTTISLSANPPAVVYGCLKHLWTAGNREHSFEQMKSFTSLLSSRLGLVTAGNVNHPLEFDTTARPDSPEHADNLRLLARCFLKVGHWQMAVKDELNESILPDILRSFCAATQCDKDWYKAWHAWALGNFEAISYYEKMHEEVPNSILTKHVVPSVQGFFRSIALSKGNSLQDALRLLTLWFKYGFQADINIAMAEGFGTVSIDTWLEVIPQLIARIHASSPHVRRLIHQLLTDVGKEHPQALVYSVTVASKSQSDARKKPALAILDKMRMHSAALVEQAQVVSEELIRVAILWPELWHEGLEEASRLYFSEQDVDGMLDALEPLHVVIDRGPETLREVAFVQAFGRDLEEAFEWSKKYKRTLNVDDLNQAWDLYYQVFRKISKQLPQLTTLELQYVSPMLMGATNLELAVPGSYRSGDPIIKIAGFGATLTVMASKQRPRRLNMVGSDGKEYQYLLKGHEDLRQDERVMQLFGLVNTLLSVDPETFKRHLSIQRYPVIPLSPNSGLIGWNRKILLNIEHRLMLQMAPDYDNLSLLQKVEVFEYALENTTGQDLYKMLWLKSKNSEVWLDRRTNYTRSLALMSMVGYILGLGDRHPSNLMLDRNAGKIIHIDFGDCFEVAMHRDKFPERIPFRLTRMLINAMEVSGIEGNFRITCENVMRVLRENKDSLMAVLEAFVYDPLLNWRLMTNASPKQDGKPTRHKLENDLLEGQRGNGNGPANRKLQHNENDLIPDGADEEIATNKPEGMNARALTVISRISNKLTGRDFRPTVTLDVPLQVQKLILQATSLENLCQCYTGWCPAW